MGGVQEWSGKSAEEVAALVKSGKWLLYIYAENWCQGECDLVEQFAAGKDTHGFNAAEFCAARHPDWEHLSTLPVIRVMQDGEVKAEHAGSLGPGTVPSLVAPFADGPVRPVPSKLRTAIFDLDGTLLDYEGVSHIALNEGLQGHGEVSWPLHASIIGTTPAHWSTKILKSLNITALTPEQYVEGYHKSVHPLCENIKLMPGAGELVQLMKEMGMTMAIATSSVRSSFETKMKVHPAIKDAMEATVCGDEVERGKPAPDIFLEAARRVGANPSDCVVFEDSPHGIAAARAAGMWAVAIPDPRLPGNDFSDAHWVLKSLDDWVAFLRQG